LRRGTLRALACAFLAVLIGCVGIESYRVSKPVAPSPGARVQREILVFGTPELRLRIRALNSRHSRDTFVIGFIPVWGKVNAPRLGDLRLAVGIEPLMEGLTLDPAGIVHVAQDGSETKPASVETPGFDYNAGVHPVSWHRGRTEAGGKAIPEGELALLKLERTTDLKIRFPVSADPEASFALRIDGVRKDGSLVSIPPIRFERGTIRNVYMAIPNE
jgi:hypothetical protein